MKTWLLILTGAFVGLWVGGLIAAHWVGDSLHHDESHIAQLTREVQSQKASINGSHRDLITCADLFHLQMSGISMDGSQVSVGWDNGGGQNAVTLPGHCINQ